MTRPDFGPGEYENDAWTDRDEAALESRYHRRVAAADARELRDNGWDAAGERAAANEEETA